jgi:F-type H+-transporting ATPase subunit alpha
MRLLDIADTVFEAIDKQVEKKPALSWEETGIVSRVSNGVAEVSGFTDASADELVAFEGGATGLALNLTPGRMSVVLLQDPKGLRPGDHARRTHAVASVPTGPQLLGRVIDPLGRPLDEGGPVVSRDIEPVERSAPAILERAPVARPLQTGIKVIDAIVPVGRGQRQLILGDRQTGKTSIAIDTIFNQKGTGVISIYCAIGQRGDAVARLLDRLRKRGVLDNCVIVVAGAEQPPGLQYIAPFAATTIAERFMRMGRDALVVYDDLTRHARAYRELSLLLRRPPGREAFPGDIFYLHSRLLERATQLRDSAGGGSLTALPIIETQAQNLSAYIPTNLISITDGQIYLAPDLFRRGQLPAVHVGRSVSRVGGKAQLPAFRTVAAPLKLAYAQFEELEAFARFGARLDGDTYAQLERGRHVREILKQPEGEPIPVAGQIAQLLAVVEGLLDNCALEEMASVAARIAERARATEAARAIGEGQPLTSEHREALLHAAHAALRGSKS